MEKTLPFCFFLTVGDNSTCPWYSKIDLWHAQENGRVQNRHWTNQPKTEGWESSYLFTAWVKIQLLLTTAYYQSLRFKLFVCECDFILDPLILLLLRGVSKQRVRGTLDAANRQVTSPVKTQLQQHITLLLQHVWIINGMNFKLF